MKEGSEDDKSKHGDDGAASVVGTPPTNANPAAALLV